MKFINREKELSELNNLYLLSKNRLISVVIYGPRRIGKTRLVQEFSKDKNHLYFFIYDGKSLNLLLQDFENILKEKKIIDNFRKLQSIEEFIEILFNYCENYVIIFDEVQYMNNIYKAFFSYMQKKIDENKNKKIMFIFLGSLIGLIKNVFEDLKSPLYGRINQELKLKSLAFKDTIKFFENKNQKKEEIVKFFSIFGGYPKYYIALEDYDLLEKDFFEVIEFLFLRENAPLQNEVINILRQEFGKTKSYYFDILSAISQGKTKLNEISSYLRKHQTEITDFMNDLLNYYEIIEREIPITDNKNTRNSVYKIKSNIIKFWFRFIYPYISYIEQNNYSYIINNIKNNINSFFGFGFEEISRQKIINEKYYDLVGRWWHKDKEIDIIGISEEKNEILFAECKWQNSLVDIDVYYELKEKSKFVNYKLEDRKNKKINEKFALFSKSGFNKKMKELAKKENVLLYDINDII
ncbi:MAG: ATP-binding protein [Candidatus Woesearchaeota archaeon]